MDLWNVMNMAMLGLAFLWSLLVMALAGNMVAMSNNNSVINYDLFVSIFGMLTLFYLIPASIKESLAFHPIVPLVLNILNLLFWFCGAVATAAKLGAHSCSNGDYLSNNGISMGSEKRCREAQASTVFLFFGCASFLFATVVSGLGMTGGSAPSRGVRRGPAMSQV